ncbi:MAG: hypothetical protein K0R68_2385 [Mycobacterium sp.]|nr:hypothetical protein [Mycobacterium sp.]
MPHVTQVEGPKGNTIYDAVDSETGEKFPDVLMIWVEDERDKTALLQDGRRVFFTTGRFDGHMSVLLRTSRIGEIDVTELAELIQDAWLSRASDRRAQKWLADHQGRGAQ